MDARIPRTVLLSMSLLTATHAVGLWEMVQLSSSLGVALWMPYSALAVVYFVLAVIFVMILRGKRWARSAYTVIAVFGFLSALGQAQNLGAIGLVVAITKVVAVVLLYLSAGEHWFDRKNALTPGSVLVSD
jgi:hypothetical protein